MRKEAEALMETAGRSPMLFENADLFYGASGWGLANLFFFERLGDEKYLKAAIDAFTEIKPKLEREGDGYFYTNADDVYSGLGHGASGIGYFLLRLHQARGGAHPPLHRLWNRLRRRGDVHPPDPRGGRHPLA